MKTQVMKPTEQNLPRPARRGFTLVELLVVIGIIALLVSILLPSLNSARRAATALVCESQMRTILQGVKLYGAAYRDAIPGSPWTSGAHIRAASDDPAFVPTGVTADSAVDKCPGVVSIFDWQSPIAKMLRITFDEGATKDSRMSRLTTLANAKIFRCPEQNSDITSFDFAGNGPIIAYPSYSTSIDFMVMHAPFRPGMSASAGARVYVGPPEANPPSGYIPRQGKIGDGSRKIFIAEGARFVDFASYPSVKIDYDSGITPTQGGMYSEVRGWCGSPDLGYNRSRILAFGYNTGSAVTKKDAAKYLLLFAKHGRQKLGGSLADYRMAVAFFDGHAEILSVTDAMNPSYWSPKNTELTIDNANCYPVIVKKYFPGTTSMTFMAK